MVSALSILFAMISVSFALPASLDLPVWCEFKATYNKNYSSKDDEQLRFQIFSDNMNKISEHNKRYEAGLETYKMAVNKFADMTHEEFVRRYLGFAGQKTSKNREIFVAPKYTELPESIDYRDKNAVNPVKDQGGCGSCWAFSAIGSLESASFLKNGKLLSLSEQNLVDCSGDYGNMGCGGGWMDQAFQYIENNGIETEAEYPYKAIDEQCLFNKTESVVKVKSFVDIKAGSEADLQAAVATQGPVSVAVDASNFQFYSGGIFSTTDFWGLNHGVVAIGYGKEDKQEYWLVRNSWGASWGEKGYIRIARNKNNQIGISNVASYPQV